MQYHAIHSFKFFFFYQIHRIEERSISSHSTSSFRKPFWTCHINGIKQHFTGFLLLGKKSASFQAMSKFSHGWVIFPAHSLVDRYLSCFQFLVIFSVDSCTQFCVFTFLLSLGIHLPGSKLLGPYRNFAFSIFWLLENNFPKRLITLACVSISILWTFRSLQLLTSARCLPYVGSHPHDVRLCLSLTFPFRFS